MAILGEVGYMMFDADAPKKPNSTPGLLHQKSPLHDLDTHKEELPDKAQGEYDVNSIITESEPSQVLWSTESDIDTCPEALFRVHCICNNHHDGR